jgi:probable rRNA maturation factor
VSVYVANESGASVDEVEMVELARHVLGDLGVHPLAELSLMLVDAAAIERLHVQYMGEEGPTDVLAFQQDEVSGPASRDGAGDGPEDVPTPLLGDVVICPAVAAAQAAEAGHPVTDELHLLCVHGILHLLGYDHADEAQEREMWGVQQRLLDSWRARAAGPR